MAEPVTFTAIAIAQLAFQEFLKTAAGELAKKFSAAAIAKMGELRQAIGNRLRGKDPRAVEALAKAEGGDEQALKTIAAFLDIEMLDPGFADRVQAIAQEIHAGKLIDQSSKIQNVYGGNAVQEQNTAGNTYNAETIKFTQP